MYTTQESDGGRLSLQVTIIRYPDCDGYPACEDMRNQTTTNSTNFPNVVYVKAAGKGKDSGDVLHYVMATVDVPSILMVHTSGATAELNFNWTRLLRAGNITDMAGSITATGGTVLYSFAVVFTKVGYLSLHKS